MLYDGTRMPVGATQRDGAGADHPGRRPPRARSTRELKALRDQYADEIRRRYPNIPRRVSGYNLDALLPENGFHVARALVGSGGDAGHDPRSAAPPGAQPAGAVAAGPRLSRRLRGAATTSTEILRPSRPAWRGSTTSLFKVMKIKGIHPARRQAAAARAAVVCWSSSAARPRTSPTTRPARCMDRLKEHRRLPR